MRMLRTAAPVLLLAIGACAHAAPPVELVNARAAYANASSSGAATEAPVALDTARRALVDAEYAWARHPGSRAAADLAYVAQRRSAEAESVARTVALERQRAEAEATTAAEQRERLRAQDAALAATRAELSREQSAREAAQQTADAALESLRRFATVREEPRGLVISLSGEVLFSTGESVLLPRAQQRLDGVASMLREHPRRTIEVQGHTDARGSEDVNETLSLARAQAVRDYLVADGVPADRIRATGYGARRPVATNATPDGRAENRRVEIVVEPRAYGGGP